MLSGPLRCYEARLLLEWSIISMALQGLNAVYRFLTGAEIRLVQNLRGNAAEPINCELHHVKLDESASYYAILYAWGDETDKR